MNDCPIKTQELEVRVAVMERDLAAFQTEMRGIREQQKAHHEQSTKYWTENTRTIEKLVESLAWAGISGVNPEEVSQRRLDQEFVRDLRALMRDLAKKTRNVIFTMMIIGALALAAYGVGAKHPEVFKVGG